jgi:beta-galactosidase/beta-glucuronidase
MMVRKEWQNLNGTWNIQGEKIPESSKILVPFPVESSLSGIGKTVEKFECIRQFTLPKEWGSEGRVLLHFGAVDWETTVFVNGKEVGKHRGGYAPFSFDITDALKNNLKSNKSVEDTVHTLSVKIFDPSNKGHQPRGKQSLEPNGVWYSSVSGIWQTVWLEPVPEDYLQEIRLSPDADNAVLTIEPTVNHHRKNLTIVVQAFDGETKVAAAYGGTGGPLLMKFNPKELKRWSPDLPHLYQLRIQLRENEKPIDQVQCYCAFRKIEVRNGASNTPRIFLNGQPFFLMGVIDQGYYPDGLYTAPSDNAMRMDIRVAKSLGFNTIRKLGKVESQRWYYGCDKMGMLVWQDLPSAENKTAEAQTEFKNEMQEILSPLHAHPSLVIWSVFNEGMGQHKTEDYVDLIRKKDATRLICGASGWADTNVGDIKSHHKFPGPECPQPDGKRALVIGSFGGLTLIPPDENLWTKNVWGFQHVSDSETLLNRYRAMHTVLRHMIKNEGLSGAVFHQLTDIESECNGLMSYDRILLKVPPDDFFKINRKTVETLRNVKK